MVKKKRKKEKKVMSSDVWYYTNHQKKVIKNTQNLLKKGKCATKEQKKAQAQARLYAKCDWAA